MGLKEKVAIIDIGSNTLRLVIYEKQNNGNCLKEIKNKKKATRLRTHLNEDRWLNQEGIRLLIKTLQHFQTIIDLYEVSETICVATATIRQAKNKDEIIQIILESTGLTINILGEYEEAYYGYLAVVNSIDRVEGITIDMGGGSTVLTYFNNRKLLQHISLPFGALSLKLQFVKGDIPTDGEILQIRQYIRSQFETISWIVNKQVPIIAMGGSARNLAKIHQSFNHYPLAGIHQYAIRILGIRDVKEKLKSLTFSELQNTEGLSKDRADTILRAIEVFEILGHITNGTEFFAEKDYVKEFFIVSLTRLQ